jgi:hypothetical protein
MKSGARLDRLPPLPPDQRSSIIPSPLDLFPSKKDTITRAFFGVETKKHVKKLESNERWLHADKLDANFGLKGDSQEDTIRRAFRRIESSNLFNPVKRQDASLAELVPRSLTSKRYVVVEESRLEELTKLEGTLRKEKELLGEQCGWALSDFQLNARLPIPATRMAVNTFCEQQMKTVEKDIIKLKEDWDKFSKQNHYNKPHLFIKDSYLKTAPPSQRAMKLRLVNSAVETWRLRKDRDSMLFEDDLSYLTGKFHEAHVRQKDYKRYYVLAARYGAYSEEEFYKDARPGRRYYIAACKGAIKFQLLWDRYWSMAKLRRYRACRMIQKYWRRRFYYKMYHPIIRLRLKIGKKTYYMFCWHQWRHYNHLCRMIKEALDYQFTGFGKKNFLALKKYVKQAHEERENRAKLMYAKSQNLIVYFKYAHWKRYTNHNKRLKRRLRRLFGFPHFDIWVNYVNWQKHLKKLNRCAKSIQGVCRTIVCRKKFLRMKRAQVSLKSFTKLVLCVRSVRQKRENLVLKEFEVWSPDESVRRTNRLNDVERQRLVKKQQFVQEKEKSAISSLRKYLNSSDGQTQIAELIRNPTAAMLTKAESGGKQFSSLHKDAKEKLAAKCLAEECCKTIRLLESHNYSTKHPPFLVCADCNCNATFTTEEQYHNHLKESSPHHGQPPQFSEFHLFLRHHRSHELMRVYITRLHGIGSNAHYIDCWYAIQEWKKIPSYNENYEVRAVNILEVSRACANTCSCVPLNFIQVLSQH